MKRSEAIIEIVARHGDAAIVFSNGLTSREAAHVADRPGNFYLLHGMGEALSVGIGMAMTAPHIPVVVVDGDGNLAMGMAALTMMPVPNLTYYVLDNGNYETTGGQSFPRPIMDAPWINRVEIEPGTINAPLPPVPDHIMNKFRQWLGAEHPNLV